MRGSRVAQRRVRGWRMVGCSSVGRESGKGHVGCRGGMVMVCVGGGLGLGRMFGGRCDGSTGGLDWFDPLRSKVNGHLFK